MDGSLFLGEILAIYRSCRERCERAAAQVDDAAFFEHPGGGPHSLATLMKHVGGNHRSRWRDFLTTDGEKRDRDRDSEFVVEGDTRASIQALWDEGWGTALASLESLGADDLARTITIRGEPHSVPRAVLRNLGHAEYHGGQIVLLARHLAGEAWEPLSVPPGGSGAFNAEMRGRFGDWWAAEETRGS